MTGAILRTVLTGLIALAVLGLVAYYVALPGEPASAQEGGAATSTDPTIPPSGDGAATSTPAVLPDSDEQPGSRSPTPTAPAPTGLNAGSPTETTVRLTWNAVTGAERYKVEYSTSSSGPWVDAFYDYPSPFRTARALECNTTYYFRARARGDGSTYVTDYGDASGSVSETTVACPTTLPTDRAPAPTGLRDNGSSGSIVRLAWDAVPGATHYLAQRSTSSGGPWSAVRFEAGLLIRNDDRGPVCGTTYLYRVRARGDGTSFSTHYGEPSDFYTVTLPPCEAPAPTGLNAESPTETTVLLSWNALTHAERYKIEYSTSSSGPWADAFYDVAVTSRTARALECSTTYHFRVRARGDGSPYLTDYGRASTGNVSATTSACTTISNLAPAPTGLHVTSKDKTIVRLAWDAVSGATHYLAQRSTSSSGPWSAVRFEAGLLIRNDDRGPVCGTTYLYRVRARGDGTSFSTHYGDPSNTITVTTVSCQPNNAPTFDDGASTTRSVEENTRAGEDIGTAVEATDSDNDTLTYSLVAGTDASSFTIEGSTGQLKTSAALDFESDSSYLFNVMVDDGRGGTDSIAVTVNITDVTEPPGTPGAPTVSRPTTNGDSELDVDWQAPSNTGPPITDYDVEYRQQGSGVSFSAFSHSGTARTTTLTGLSPNTTYEVQVRATNAEGTGSWSASGTGSTGSTPLPGNNAPTFDDGASTTRSVEENTPIGTKFGSPISATDSDNDTLTYSLVAGADASSFRIAVDNGQLFTNTGLDYESKNRYEVTVMVDDGRGGSAKIDVTVNVTDVPEVTKLAKPVGRGLDGGLDVVPIPAMMIDPTDGGRFGKREIRLVWNAVTDATAYIVEARAYGGSHVGAWEKVRDETLPFTKIDIDSILKSGDGLADAPYGYQFQVMATAPGFGDSEYSDPVTIVDTPITRADGDSRSNAEADFEWVAVPTIGAGGGDYTLRYRKFRGNPTSKSWTPNMGLGVSQVTEKVKDTKDTISPLELNSIYAVQLRYRTSADRVYAARDVYVWPANRPAEADSYVAGFQVLHLLDNETYTYRVCDLTFPADKVGDWKDLMERAFDEWRLATGLVSADYDDTACHDYSTFVESIKVHVEQALMRGESPDVPAPIIVEHVNTFLANAKHSLRVLQADDGAQKEIVMFDDVEPEGAVRYFAVTGAFKEFADKVGYHWAWDTLGRDWRGTRAFYDPNTHDMFIRRGAFEGSALPPNDSEYWPPDPLELPGNDDLKADRNEIRFNSCKDLLAPDAPDHIVHVTAFGTLVHEVGHAFGLRHPRLEVAGAIMNQLSEPDCSPHPLDIMAIHALYQTKQ